MSQFKFPWKISEAATERLNEKAQIFRLKAGAPLYEEGKVCDMVFQIVEGQAQVQKTMASGKTIGLYLVEKENLCPLALQSCLLWQPAIATCRTTQETEIVCLPAADFAQLLSTEEGLAKNVIDFLDKSLATIAASYTRERPSLEAAALSK